MPSRLISARFAGKCRCCGKVVYPGQPVWFAKHFGVKCQDCGPHTADEPRLTQSKYKGHHRGRSNEPAPVPPPRSESPTPSLKRRPATRGADGVHRFEFASVTEAVADALDDFAQTDGNLQRIRSDQARALSGKDKWGHCFTRERLLDELRNPSQSLLTAIDEMRQRLIGDLDLPVTPKRKVRRGLDHGDELDADRYLARDPYAWERSVREPQPRRTVTIGCNLAVNAHHRPDQLLYRGAAALALADLLTQRGLNVRLVAFFVSRNPTQTVDRSVVSYLIKSADMPLDLSSVAFCLCEIAFARIVAVQGGARHWPGRLHKAFGYADRLPTADRNGIDYLIDADCLSREAAEAWLRSQLQQQEVCNV